MGRQGSKDPPEVFPQGSSETISITPGELFYVSAIIEVDIEILLGYTIMLT
jgi:hypothetical protein